MKTDKVPLELDAELRDKIQAVSKELEEAEKRLSDANTAVFVLKNKYRNMSTFPNKDITEKMKGSVFTKREETASGKVVLSYLFFRAAHVAVKNRNFESEYQYDFDIVNIVRVKNKIQYVSRTSDRLTSLYQLRAVKAVNALREIRRANEEITSGLPMAVGSIETGKRSGKSKTSKL